MNRNKYLSDIEAKTFETFLNDRMKYNTRECLLFLLAMKTGARASELLAVTRGDLDIGNRTVFIKGTKGSNDREIPIHYDLFRQLHTYAHRSGNTEVIFPISYDRWYQLWLSWRPVKKNPHCLRHTAAIQFYKKTRNIRLTQVLLGHRSLSSTEVYSQYVFNQEELRKAIL